MKASVRSLRELPKLQLVRPQITKAGSVVKARWPGRREFVFGATPELAASRLRTATESGFLKR